LYVQTIIFIFVVMIKCDSKFCGCLYYSTNALARIITKMAEDEFSITGLSPSYAFLIMSINLKPGVQPKDLSEEMQLTPSTITRLIEKLEYKGYVVRKNMGKTTEIYPTEKSIDLDAKIKEAWINLYKKYSGILGEDEGIKLTSEIYSTVKKLET
jgi:MarR family transcriptional regulator, organic hydroperoxide resistance regulator